MKKVKYAEWAEQHPVAPPAPGSSMFAGHAADGTDGAATDERTGPLQTPPGAAGPTGAGTVSAPVAYAPPANLRRRHHGVARTIILSILGVAGCVLVYLLVVLVVGQFDTRYNAHTDPVVGYEVSMPAKWDTFPAAELPPADQLDPMPATTAKTLYAKRIDDKTLVGVVSEIRPVDPNTPIDKAMLDQLSLTFLAANHTNPSSESSAQAITVDGRPAVRLHNDLGDLGAIDTLLVADGNRALALVVTDAKDDRDTRSVVGEIVDSFRVMAPEASG